MIKFSPGCLSKRFGYCTYTIELSTNTGKTIYQHFSTLAQTATDAAQYTLKELQHTLTGNTTFIIYHHPVIHRPHTMKPNELELIMDYEKNKWYIIPWSIHKQRTAAGWNQLAFSLTA